MIRTVDIILPVETDGLLADMPVTISEQCATCANWLNGLTCRAFPSGIPDAILDGEHDHRAPFDGDGGIRYDPIPR